MREDMGGGEGENGYKGNLSEIEEMRVEEGRPWN